jgi:hypothetical protein
VEFPSLGKLVHTIGAVCGKRVTTNSVSDVKEEKWEEQDQDTKQKENVEHVR